MKINFFDEVPSCLDTAFELAQEGNLQPWDSVQAAVQTQGRGQMRRQWFSPKGNIYAALRLPLEGPFKTTAAAPFMGLLCARALQELKCLVWLKWPNDLILETSCGFGKVAGILVEEKNDILLAGIGINVSCAPQFLRPGSAVQAFSLSDALGASINGLGPEKLWRLVVKHIFCTYRNTSDLAENWVLMADELLLWRNRQVELLDGDKCIRGRFVGVGGNGALILENEYGLKEFLGGSLRPLAASQGN